MNITFNKTSEDLAQLNLAIQSADYEPAVDKKAKELAKTASIKGFRPGKVPANHIKKLYGKSLVAEVLDEFINNATQEYLRDNNIGILFQPLASGNDGVKEEADGSLSLSLDVALAPTLNLPELKDISVTQYEIELTEEDVDKLIVDFAKSSPSTEKVEIFSHPCDLFGNLVQVGGSYSQRTLIPSSRINESQLGLFAGAKAEDVIKFDLRETFQEEHVRHVLGLPAEEADAMSGEFELTISQINVVLTETSIQTINRLFKAEAQTEEEAREVLKNGVKTELDNMTLSKRNADVVTKISELVGDVQVNKDFVTRWFISFNKNSGNEKEVTAEDVEKDFEAIKNNIVWSLVQRKADNGDNVKVTEEAVIDFTKQEMMVEFQRMGLPVGSLSDELLTNFAIDRLKKDRKNYSDAINKTYSFLCDQVIFNSVSTVSQKISLADFQKLS